MKINETVLICEKNRGFLTALTLLVQKEFEEEVDYKETAKIIYIIIYIDFDLYDKDQCVAYIWFVKNAIKTKRVFKKME